MDIQIYRILEEEYSNDLFRSEISHMRNHFSDKEIVEILIKYNMVEVFWKKKWYFKAFYILALLDYLSDKYNAPYFHKYDYYRTRKLKDVAYPSGILLLDKANIDANIKKKTIKECKQDSYGKYFLKYNIVELEENR